MAGIQPGHMAYMEYLGYPGVVHARLILAHVAGHDWVIATPDGHVYTETLDSSNADLSHFWHVAGGALPRGVRGENVYAFAPMSAATYARYMADGRQEALDEQARRGVVVPPAAPRAGEGPVGDAPDPGRHESDEIWVLAEWIDGHLIGEESHPSCWSDLWWQEMLCSCGGQGREGSHPGGCSDIEGWVGLILRGADFVPLGKVFPSMVMTQ